MPPSDPPVEACIEQSPTVLEEVCLAFLSFPPIFIQPMTGNLAPSHSDAGSQGLLSMPILC